MTGTCQFNAFNHHFDYSEIKNLARYFGSAVYSNIYVNPCGPTYCPYNKQNDTACCYDYSISYGSLSDVHVAKSPLYTEASPAFEFSYGSGELCNNGVPRKSVFTFVCDRSAADKSSFRSVSSHFDDCTTSAIIYSAGACPVVNSTGIPVVFLVSAVSCAFAFKCCLVCCTLYFCRRRKSAPKDIKGAAAKRIGNRLLGKRICKKATKNTHNNNSTQEFGAVYELVPGGMIVNDYEVPMEQLHTQTETV